MKFHISRRVLCIVSIAAFGLLSCKVSKREGSVNPVPPTPPNPPFSSCTSTANLGYNSTTCPSTGGCTFTFTCNLQTPSPESQNTFKRFVSSLTQIFQAPTPVTLNVSTLTINQPSLLQATAGDADPNWYNNSISCSQDGTTVTCSNFLPIADDFTIQGTLGDLDVTVDVTVDNQITLGVTTECGQMGTTVQRMFDCSQRVTNYAGFGTGANDNGFTSFVPGTSNPDTNWFLVSCPGTDNQQCFWLSPVMTGSNQSLGAGQFDSFHNPMSNYANGRLLWSGVFSPNVNFFQANGKNPFNNPTDSYYEYYEYDGTITNIQNYTSSIYNPDSSESIKVNNTYSTAWNAVTDDLSICATAVSPNILPGSQYVWQIPSYPMVMTLTGGGSNGGYCGSNPGNIAFCNPDGFRAIAQLPGFDNSGSSSTYFWSSSVASPSYGWLFFGNDGIVDLDFLDADFPSVRCSSAAW